MCCAELAERRGWEKPGIFLGVYNIGESREVMNLTSLKLLQFVFSQNSRNSDRRDQFRETNFAFFFFTHSILLLQCCCIVMRDSRAPSTYQRGRDWHCCEHLSEDGRGFYACICGQTGIRLL